MPIYYTGKIKSRTSEGRHSGPTPLFACRHVDSASSCLRSALGLDPNLAKGRRSDTTRLC